MGRVKELAMIEQEFCDVLEVLSPKECQRNHQLRRKTKKVARLINKLVHAGESLREAVRAKRTTASVTEEDTCEES